MRGDLVWRGTQPVDALVVAEADAARSVLASWVPGSRLDRLGDGSILLRFPDPVMMACAVAPGLPLIRTRDHLSGLPPRRMPRPVGAVVVARGGEVVADDLVAPIDPGTLLDLDGWRVVRPPPAPPPPPPPPLRDPADSAPVDLRAELTGLGAPDARTERQRRRLEREASGEAGPRSPAGAPTRTRMPSGASTPGLLDRFRAIRNQTPGRQRAHERYVDEVRAMLARGELDEALRRAIPMGGDGRLTSWAIPKRRDDLRIRPERSGGGSSAPLRPELQSSLRGEYRSAFEELDRQGRHLDAAYVLAELLDETEEACTYLERHDQVELAAKVAEARSNDPSLVVRLWWNAGDKDRALVVARRHGCHAQAIARLERAGDEGAAAELRHEWARLLVDGGDLIGSLDALGTLDDPQAQHLRAQIFADGLARPGPIRATLLARQLRSGAPAPSPALDEICTDPDADAERLTLIAALVRTSQPVDHPRALLPLVRRSMGDVGRTQLKALVRLTGDQVLEADLPAPVRPAVADRAPATTTIAAHDRGVTPALDATALADGSVLVALGHEVRLLRTDGRTLATFDVPAHRVIPSDHGTHALAIRSVGQRRITVWVLDLLARRHRVLGEIEADCWALGYDGTNWFVTSGTELWMLDLVADGPSATWKLDDAEGTILAIARSPEHLAIAVYAGKDPSGGARVLRRSFALPLLREQVAAMVRLGPEDGLVADGAIIPGAADATQHALLTCVAGPEPSVHVNVLLRHGRVSVAGLVLDGVETCTARIDGTTAITADALGRVERLDTVSGRRLPPIRTTI